MGLPPPFSGNARKKRFFYRSPSLRSDQTNFNQINSFLGSDYFTNLINQIVSLFPTIPPISPSINTQYDVSDDKSRVEEIKRKSLEDKIL